MVVSDGFESFAGFGMAGGSEEGFGFVSSVAFTQQWIGWQEGFEGGMQ
jgi:hypothetical protein